MRSAVDRALTIFFTAEKRVDFRLWSAISRHTCTDQLRQIGVRDEAARLRAWGGRAGILLLSPG
jgi:cell fate regulator YaaT (PSP1 superfamily)